MLGVLELVAVLQVGSHDNREVESPPLTCWPILWCSTGYAQFSGMQAHIDGTFPASHPPAALSLSWQCCFQSLHTPVYIILGFSLTQVQDLELGLIGRLEVLVGSLLKLLQVPLDGMPSFRCVNPTMVSFANLLRVHLIPMSLIKNIKLYLSPSGPLRDTSCYWHTSGHWTLDHRPLDDIMVQPIPHSSFSK